MADTHGPSRLADRAVGPAPLVPAAIGLVAGIVWDDRAPLDVWWYAVGFVVAAGWLLWRAPRARYAVALAVVAAACIGGLLHHRSFRRLPADHVFHFTADAPAIARLRGTVLTGPRVYKRGNPPFERWSFESYRTSFFIEAESIEGAQGFLPATGRVRVAVKEAVLAIREGDRVELFGYLYRPVPPSNPGQFDWSVRDRRGGVFAAFVCDHDEGVRRLADGRPRGLRFAWASVRRHVRGLLLGDMVHHGGADMSLLDAMVLGRRGAIDRDLNETFVRTGCAHFLAVSGMHVCMLGAFFWLAGRVVGLTRRGCAVLAIIVTVAYAVVVEPRPPIFRAATMTTVYCVSLLLYRPRSTLNTIALAAIIILCWRPTALFGPGFQLSFAAVLGIVYLPPLIECVPVAAYRRVRRRRLDPFDHLVVAPAGWWVSRTTYLIRPVPIAIAAWFAGLPLVLIYFQRVSLWGWLNTVLVAIPVFVVMVAGFLKILSGIAFPGLAGPLTPMVEYPATVLAGWVDLLGRLPGVSMHMAAPPWWLVVLYYGVLAAWVCVHHRPCWWRRAAEVAAAAIQRGRSRDPDVRRGDALTVTVLPVGHGAATVVELPDGGVVLYDAGSVSDDSRSGSVLMAFLRSRGIRHVNMVLVSHPHRDHYSDVLNVIDSLDAGPVCITPHFEPLAARDVYSAEWLRRVRQRNHPIQLVTSDAGPIQLSGARMEFLWPPATPPFVLDPNDSSLVVRVGYQGRSVLLCGDIRDDAQAWLAHQVDVTTDVVVLPHHGAVTKSTPRLVAETGARHLVCSRSDRPDSDGPLVALAADHELHDTSGQTAVEVALARDRTSVRRTMVPAAPNLRRIERMPAFVMTMLLVLLGMMWWFVPTGSRDGLTMTVLSVGRGTSVVLELPDGETLLYDAGASGVYDPGAGTIVPYLRHGGVRHVNQVFVSHPNMDHFSGLLSVVDRVSTGPILISPYFEPLSTPDKPSNVLLDEFGKREHPVSVISSEQPARQFGDVTIETLWPPPHPPFELGSNDSSLVLRVRYAGTSILLPGDIEQDAQQWLLGHADLSADVLLLPHHGSMRTNTAPFIKAVNPTYAIRSSFERTEATQTRPASPLDHCLFYNTADVGAVTVTIDARGLGITGFRQ
ncbi:MAG: ComEC/Rec2 family competence protein [Phycisphaerales bacterium]|nr:MAG: ComEC/Rec2 family competence protein [Phycisphaerales bacterium]